jgi:hypothetical protein
MAQNKGRRARGSGSVSRLARGRYLVRFTIPASPGRDAQRKSQVVHGTERDANAVLAAWSDEMRRDAARAAEDLMPRSRMLLDPFVRFHVFPYLDRRVEKGDRMRARTASEYRKVALNRVLPVLGHRRTSELRAADADVLARALLAQGLRPNTVRRALDVLKLIVRVAETPDENGMRVCPPGTAASMNPWLPEAKPVRPRLTPQDADKVTKLLLAEARLAEPPAAVLPALLVATSGDPSRRSVRRSPRRVER